MTYTLVDLLLNSFMWYSISLLSFFRAHICSLTTNSLSLVCLLWSSLQKKFLHLKLKLTFFINSHLSVYSINQSSIGLCFSVLCPRRTACTDLLWYLLNCCCMSSSIWSMTGFSASGKPYKVAFRPGSAFIVFLLWIFENHSLGCWEKMNSLFFTSLTSSPWLLSAISVQDFFISPTFSFTLFWYSKNFGLVFLSCVPCVL